jgi:hypothetical protein
VIELDSVTAFLLYDPGPQGGYSSPLRALGQAQDGASGLVFLVYRLMSSISLRMNQVFEPPNIRFLNPQESGFPLLTFHPTLWYNICSCTLAVLIPDVGGSLYSSSGYVIIEVLVNLMIIGGEHWRSDKLADIYHCCQETLTALQHRGELIRDSESEMMGVERVEERP